MELEIDIEAPTAEEFGIQVLADQDGNKGFTISSGQGSKTLNVGYINPFELKEGGSHPAIFITEHDRGLCQRPSNAAPGMNTIRIPRPFV